MNRKIATYSECIDKLCALVEADCELSDAEYKTLSALFYVAETMLAKKYPQISK